MFSITIEIILYKNNSYRLSQNNQIVKWTNKSFINNYYNMKNSYYVNFVIDKIIVNMLFVRVTIYTKLNKTDC